MCVCVCELNCGSFFIALAQHTFIDYFFQIPWIIFSFLHNNSQTSVYLQASLHTFTYSFQKG